eukprot:Blabericola_migrator_1__158@NODE_1041_length_5625_cov_143_923893_g717_i0_p4_GENE_NODE_1041_length_5625_cov_143_923893_g717_i0NODE_1041_length_5625_cov_143_923893_g717_i0_p4_ORF_typecomplete_len150_score42_37Tho1_MOS11_C/PF18592_1/0_056Tho1_MOS11_C/PF18592_1/0_00012Tho1_MOS11_C/PF18592_1/5_4e10SYCE1/PF15233_6/24SYCE1/PF15233_6/0_049DUF3106/PF11304_8/0_11DUF3106/PF11304_8/1_2e02_NODE_1041_length_5625_cov_143_923893_g717_i023832832
MVNQKTPVATVAPKDDAKVQARAKRFGTYSDEQKAKLRAARFGTFNKDLESEKLNKRKERFGVGKKKKESVIGTLEATPEEESKRIQRAKRFGVSCAALDDEKKKQRAQRFGIGQEIDLMNKHLTGPQKTAEPDADEKEEGYINEDDGK